MFDMIPETRRRRGKAAQLWGIAAEEQAEAAYGRRDAKILARRWACREGEIDLVAEDGGCLVFVEVKARRTTGQAAGVIDRRKWQRLETAATRYLLAEGRGLDCACRFDVALVDRLGGVEIVENAGQF